MSRMEKRKATNLRAKKARHQRVMTGEQRMKTPIKKTETRVIEFWSCQVDGHRHRTKEIAQKCINLMEEKKKRKPFNVLSDEFLANALGQWRADRLTFKALGARLGVCGQRARQIIDTAARKLEEVRLTLDELRMTKQERESAGIGEFMTDAHVSCWQTSQSDAMWAEERKRIRKAEQDQAIAARDRVRLKEMRAYAQAEGYWPTRLYFDRKYVTYYDEAGKKTQIDRSDAAALAAWVAIDPHLRAPIAEEVQKAEPQWEIG